jgi:hypothetical protein
VPITPSTSCDQVIFVDQASGASMPADAVQVEIDIFGDRRDSYETDMREILTQASPSGQFPVRLPDNILRIWRLPA